MSQLEYTNSYFSVEFHESNYSRCLISKHYNYFLLGYRHIHSMCATSGTWHRHLCHFMEVGVLHKQIEAQSL